MITTTNHNWGRTPLSCLAAVSLLLTTGGLVSTFQNPVSAQVGPAEVLVNETEPVSADPLGSPFPLPWAWVNQHQQRAAAAQQTQTISQKTAIFVSPDGMYQAQAELILLAHPDFSRNQLTSILTVTHTQTQQVQQWQSTALIDPNLRQELAPDGAGLIAVLWPVGWSASGEQLLVRNVQGIFSSDFVSDVAVIWSRPSQALTALWPQQAEYDHAILLGWSQENPQQVLFETATMGQAAKQIWAVDPQQEMLAQPSDRPQVYGQTLPVGVQAQSLPGQP